MCTVQVTTVGEVGGGRGGRWAAGEMGSRVGRRCSRVTASHGLSMCTAQEGGK